MAELDSYKQTFIVTIVLITCVSCGTVPPLVKPDRLLRMSDGELRNVDRDNLCRGYAKTKSKRIASAINDLDFMNEKDWEALNSGEFYVGMSECVIFIDNEPLRQCLVTTTYRDKKNDLIKYWNCRPSLLSGKRPSRGFKIIDGKAIEIYEAPLEGFVPRLLRHVPSPL